MIDAEVQRFNPKEGDLIIITVEKEDYNADLGTREIFDREVEAISQKYPGATFLVLPRGVTVQQLPEPVAKSVLKRIIGDKR